MKIKKKMNNPSSVSDRSETEVVETCDSVGKWCPKSTAVRRHCV